jgi:prepilin-type N-terminal cleavage/methylation domain-containing protein
MNLKKGFTLIELLVVIAIIGILSSVVLASLNTARSRGSDASAKASMSSIRAEAELSADGGSYANVCEDVVQLLNAADDATGNTNTCVDLSNAYGAEIELRSGEFFCVDYTGVATTTAASSGLLDTSTTTATCDGV